MVSLQVACGSGRDAIYLAGRGIDGGGIGSITDSSNDITGWKVTGVDNVQLRLSKLTEQSEREKCHVATLLLDLEPDLAPSPSNNWDEIQAQLLCGNVGYLFLCNMTLPP